MSITIAEVGGIDSVAAVHLIKDMDGIECLRESWTRLAWHPNSDINFYRIVLESMPGAKPWILAIERAGSAELILVGRIQETRQNMKVGYLAIPGLKTRTITFIYGGLLGCCTPEDARMLAERIQQALREGEADAVAFNHLRADSPLYAAMHDVKFRCGRDPFPDLQNHLRSRLPASAADFRSRLSAGVRKNLRWECNKLLKAHEGQVTIRCLSDPFELPLLIREVEGVAALTYQRGMGVGFRDSPEERERLRVKAEHGWLRAYLLYIKGQCRAFWVGTLYCGTLHSDYMGYDPDYRSYSPGTYLVVNVIESLCRPEKEREIEAVDFGLGDAWYKRLFGDEHWQDVSLCTFGLTPRGILRSSLRFPFLAADKLLRKLLSANLERRVKRLWRKVLAEKVGPDKQIINVLSSNKADGQAQIRVEAVRARNTGNPMRNAGGKSMDATKTMESGHRMRVSSARNRAVHLLKLLWTEANEWALGISTVGEESHDTFGALTPGWWRGEHSNDARFDDNHQYATADYWNLRLIIRALHPGSADVFYDIGCGKGRILCLMARLHIKRCVGIELFEPLCEMARKNAKRLRGRKAPIEVQCADAVKANLSEGTIYWLANPFGAQTLEETLENIRRSVAFSPRSITIVYYNPTFSDVFVRSGWLRKTQEISVPGGKLVSFWKNDPARPASSTLPRDSHIRVSA